DSVAGVLAVPTRRGRVLCRVLDALHHFFGIQVRIHGAYECGDSADVGCRVTGALDFRGLSFVDHAVRQALRLRSGIERQDFGPGRGDIDPGAVHTEVGDAAVAVDGADGEYVLVEPWWCDDRSRLQFGVLFAHFPGVTGRGDNDHVLFVHCPVDGRVQFLHLLALRRAHRVAVVDGDVHDIDRVLLRGEPHRPRQGPEITDTLVLPRFLLCRGAVGLRSVIAFRIAPRITALGIAALGIAALGVAALGVAALGVTGAVVR